MKQEYSFLRIKKELHDKIKSQAAKERRTLVSIVEYALEKYFKEQK